MEGWNIERPRWEGVASRRGNGLRSGKEAARCRSHRAPRGARGTERAGAQMGHMLLLWPQPLAPRPQKQTWGGGWGTAQGGTAGQLKTRWDPTYSLVLSLANTYRVVGIPTVGSGALLWWEGWESPHLLLPRPLAAMRWKLSCPRVNHFFWWFILFIFGNKWLKSIKLAFPSADEVNYDLLWYLICKLLESRLTLDRLPPGGTGLIIV